MLKRATTKLHPWPASAPPVRYIHGGSAGTPLAVHIHGELRDDTPPIVCLPGYVRNMTDFAALAPAINRHPETGFAFILIDLPGRGRSGTLPKGKPYASFEDVDCVFDVLTALDVSNAVVLGEGHGGQIAMLMAQRRPSVVAGAVLVDAGPVTESRGLVRTRNNFQHLSRLRGESAIRPALRKMLATDHPGEIPARLDALADRTYAIDGRGRFEPLFDPRLIAQLDQFDFDDVLEPQWALFACLDHAPLMIVHTRLSTQLRRATYDEMVRRRPDAATLSIEGQGSPALLDAGEEQDALASFLRLACRPADGEPSAL